MIISGRALLWKMADPKQHVYFVCPSFLGLLHLLHFALLFLVLRKKKQLPKWFNQVIRYGFFFFFFFNSIHWIITRIFLLVTVKTGGFVDIYQWPSLIFALKSITYLQSVHPKSIFQVQCCTQVAFLTYMCLHWLLLSNRTCKCIKRF